MNSETNYMMSSSNSSLNPSVIISESSQSSSRSSAKKRKNEVLIDSDTGSDSWPAFLVLSTRKDYYPATRIKPFALGKAIAGCAGDVKQVKKLRSGYILIECSRKQQAINLLSLKNVVTVPVFVSPHSSLNSC